MLHRKLFIILLLFFFSACAYSQRVRVDNMYINVPPSRKESVLTSLKFPRIQTGNRKTDSLIMRNIFLVVTDNEYRNLSLRKGLEKYVSETIVDMDFEVTLNRNNLLSLHVFVEVCGANCSVTYYYFTFSTKTGKPIWINSLLDTTSDFKSLVSQDFLQQLELQKKEIKEQFEKGEGELDSTDYETALEYYQECENDFNLQTFALYPDHIEIIRDCYVPRFIRPLTPFFELKYPYSRIKPYIRKGIKL